MEVKTFQILLILSLTGLKTDKQCDKKKCIKRILTAPAVKGLIRTTVNGGRHVIPMFCSPLV